MAVSKSWWRKVRGMDRLAFRLALVLAIALLPLMIVSILRSQSMVNQAVERSQAALTGETLKAVQQEVVIIERAKASARMLSQTVPKVLDNPELCNQIMRDVLIDTDFTFAGFYDLNGDVPCSNADAPFSFGLTDNIKFQIANPIPIVLVNPDAPVSGTSVFYASHPVKSDDGDLIGFTSISVPHFKLQYTSKTQSDALFLTIGSKGRVITAPIPLDEAAKVLPEMEQGVTLLTLPASFRSKGVDGVDRLYASVPIIENELVALATWPEAKELRGGFYFQNPVIFPALMFLASLGVAWFATSLFVTRHVLKLREAMRQFAEIRKTTEPETFHEAPRELRDVAMSFSGMTDTILRDEANIEDSLRQKDVLLREVHHRVKNNLQLIASIMGMQMRQSRSPEVQGLMKGLHDRVTSLATIHQNLYQTSGQADVAMAEHLKTISRQVMRMGSMRERDIDVRTSIAPLTLNPDQAVPLSLFVTEAMTNALKYIGPDKSDVKWLRLELTRPAPGDAQVIISNSIRQEERVAEGSTGLGTELMAAFSEQLDGTLEKSDTDDCFTVTLRFPIEELSPKPN